MPYNYYIISTFRILTLGIPVTKFNVLSTLKKKKSDYHFKLLTIEFHPRFAYITLMFK